MLDCAQILTNSSEPAGVLITATKSKTVLRLKSWELEQGGGHRVKLAGRELPLQVGAILPGVTRILCTGRREWLLISAKETTETLRARMRDDLEVHGLSLVDLSDGTAGLELGGAASRELLSKGCGLDFHPSVFPPGRCARTRFAQIPVIVECLDESFRFQLLVARSYQAYLHAWMIDAAAEFEAT